MNVSEVKMWINDYLDLYLYAKSRNDHLWQQEIIEILQKSNHYIIIEARDIDPKNYLEKYNQN
ncbi:hypothetical protein [Neobacillus cucumis]|uniref:hypothetical protein n=1 Tax=Neobacillus cucumis TaxID=1740721 RepID=UPI0028536E17|nr:hypothetical protein [Neobacillus cucumis]MDR4947753.1 hypothetical protein [Neobacillus cucumis]